MFQRLDRDVASVGGRLGVGDELQRVRERSAELLPADRVLMELVLSGERSIRSVARLLGQDPGTTARRYRRLVKRLRDPYVVALIEGRVAVTGWERRVAMEHDVRGLSVKSIAEIEGVGQEKVKRAIAFARGAALGQGIVRGGVPCGTGGVGDGR